jgi:hypothetical protein
MMAANELFKWATRADFSDVNFTLSAYTVRLAISHLSIASLIYVSVFARTLS